MGCRTQTATTLNSCTHKDAQPLFTSKCSIQIQHMPEVKLNTLVWAHTAHLHVLSRHFIVCPGVRGSTTGGCSPPRMGAEGTGKVTALLSGLAATSDSPRWHSQEGMPYSVTDVSYGFHVHTVIMQRLGVRCRTCFCQEDTKPPSEIFRAARLTGRNPKTEFLISRCSKLN